MGILYRERFGQLKKLLRETGTEFSEIRLGKTWEYAVQVHQGQARLSGEPYVFHCLETAKLVVAWGLDEDAVVAALLHDAVEDAGVSLEKLSREFGEKVAQLVDGVTKVSGIKLRGSDEENFVENLRKMFFIMSRDLRVVLIRLADRLHNMRTLSVHTDVKRKRIAKETLEVYAPLAERLSMGVVKAELEDLSFFYLYPEEYERVKEITRPFYKKTEECIREMKKKLLSALVKEGIAVSIQAREKHLYTLWKKLQREEIDWDMEKIHDIVAIRIIVQSVDNCYLALGIVHHLFKPVPAIGVSDYIAQPKPNGYRSIHTKVFGFGGRIVEVQIRTEEMHEEAEYGVAAHWKYSQVKGKAKREGEIEKKTFVDAKMSWVRQLAKWQKEIADSGEFLEGLKRDVLGHRIYVFSPKGDVFELPEGSTPVDYAFAVHTNLGSFIKGAVVNEKIVSLDKKLKSGDVVNILKSKNPVKPNKRWLDFVVTNLAKREIKK